MESISNRERSFSSEVIENFADSYLAGRTPIPCVACNKKFKFDEEVAKFKATFEEFPQRQKPGIFVP